ncbi:molybdate ABC transporter substrate-binding protein [Effusibacillus pohliae]|uniref:molybdate ABC transporter substrate-binding protein n=1 Tax=Effusibacillus pohliae TaxID=232270 RepID=UPI0003737FA0|nr:molybdate ABC transporter substrate-binding protein [Effusibacillus pohliae]
MLSFRLKKRLRHFTLDISQQIGAETLVLIGHSGCGKSTTLRMLAGLLSPDEGIIELNGRSLWDGRQGIDVPPEQRKIGFVFQNYALFPHLTVIQNVAYGIHHLSDQEKQARVRESLALLGIESLAQAKPAMLSGGEQQRVALARALVTRPELLLLDEPLSALDISTRSHVRAELKELLRKLSIPTIVVTHDYEDARVLADRIVVMDRGAIVQTGSHQQISQFPASRFVAQFTGTNLLPITMDKHVEEAWGAFDPWTVEVSREPTGARYEWSGIIRDIAWIGGFVRLYVEGPGRFLADVPVDQAQREAYQVGQAISVRVPAAAIRTVPSVADSEDCLGKPDEGAKNGQQPPKNRWKRVLAAVSAMLVISLVTGYGMKAGSPTKQVNMTALVAANATDPFNDLIRLFEQQHPGVKVVATYAGTQVLRTQLEQGAKADLFLSADLSHIEAIRGEGLTDRFFPVSRSHAMIVVPRQNPAGIRSLQDLGTKPVKLVIGVDSVPIGRYTRQIFEKANQGYGGQFSKNVLSHVVSFESNTKAVLQKVALGEAEAGIVYRTDVTAGFQEKVMIVEIPESYNVDATNYIAVPTNAPHPELANQFVQLMLSPDGQAVFRKYGYDELK